jgi:hypothetical protein
MIVHIYNLSTPEAEPRGSQDSSPAWATQELRVSLGYIGKTHLKKGVKETLL